MAFNVNNFAKIEDVGVALNLANDKIDSQTAILQAQIDSQTAILQAQIENATDNDAFKSATVENDTVKFYKNTSGEGVAAFSFELPKTDIKIDSSTSNILTSTPGGLFVDGANIETEDYLASDTSLEIESHKIKVKIDSAENNILSLTEGGLFVDGSNIGNAPSENDIKTASDSDVAEFLNTTFAASTEVFQTENDNIAEFLNGVFGYSAEIYRI